MSAGSSRRITVRSGRRGSLSGPQHTSEESIMVRRAQRSENDQLTGLKTGSSVTKGFAEGVRRGETHPEAVSYTHLRAHETRHDLVCRLLLEKKKTKNQ